MVSILGKRSRITSYTSPCTPRAKRLSRQIQVHHDNGNNAGQTAVHESVGHQAASKLSLLQLATPSNKKRDSRPSKHGGTTPSTANSTLSAHFSISKLQSNAEDRNAKAKCLPATPRHRDVTIKSLPATPQNRVLVPGSVKTPDTLGARTTVAKPNPYAQARQLFAGACESSLLVGRDEERAQVTAFIADHLKRSSGGCLYISGPPGTGKSAFVTDVLRKMQTGQQTTTAMINCMSIRSSAELLQTIALDLDLHDSGSKFDGEMLKSTILSTAGNGMLLLMLDEVDRLVDLDLALLYLLFEWSMQPNSRLILVGIANALDLTDRLLPRLKSRNIKPCLLPFMPYNATQINDIITTKLRSLTEASAADPLYLPLMQPAAVLLCSKKVASSTGDLRTAFDIIRRALSLAESAAIPSLQRCSSSKPALALPLSENINLSSPPVAAPSPTKVDVLAQLTAETAPRATISHVAKVTSQIFSHGTSTRLGHLSMQQKAVLCALAVYEKKARSSLSHALSSMASFVPPTPSKSGRATRADSPSVKQLYDSYAELCGRERALHALSSLEFKDVISSLETLSLVEYVVAKGKSATLGLMTPSRTPSRKGRKKADFGQMSLGGIGAGGDERRLSSVVGFAELNASLVGPGSDILKDLLDG